ncbi:hypothetical protein [Corallococcus llansteffanensis]|uniref:Uncharacterized protein n=1 Tax=Corallococcus llansteffanensis TaxID=2316731 RepID=A0A3A8QSD1_9BACT|nr:hypothetical protein [Corallococcus llansteffanensis]RKH67802.1 hypothetical protein D7V93_02320 [Corallococcus llansteffanensis]
MTPLKVTLHELTNAGEKTKAFVQRAIQLMEEVVNTQGFRDAVAQQKFSYIHHHGTDHSKDALMRYLFEGRELGTDADHEIDLRINLRAFYYGFRPIRVLNKKTVGSTNLGGPVIHTNLYHINNWVAHDDVASGVGHWLHEWMHVVGYEHEDANGDENDVAYAIGAIAEHIAWERLGSSRALSSSS